MISGEYRYAMDEKGRLMVPAPIRRSIAGNLVVLTRAIDRCLWLFAPEEWQAVSGKLTGSSSLFLARDRMLGRRFLAPAQEIEIDRSGRIAIPPTLRDYAGLHKDCIVLGINSYVEVWDEETYRAYELETDDQYKEAAEQIGGSITL